jgi:hypothetical protein
LREYLTTAIQQDPIFRNLLDDWANKHRQLFNIDAVTIGLKDTVGALYLNVKVNLDTGEFEPIKTPFLPGLSRGRAEEEALRLLAGGFGWNADGSPSNFAATTFSRNGIVNVSIPVVVVASRLAPIAWKLPEPLVPEFIQDAVKNYKRDFTNHYNQVPHGTVELPQHLTPINRPGVRNSEGTTRSMPTGPSQPRNGGETKGNCGGAPNCISTTMPDVRP